MKKTLTLDNPILINGKPVSEIDYDVDEITGELFAEADSRKMSASGSHRGNLAGAPELDYSLHLYLGYAAMIAVNPAYDWNDLARIKGHDNMKVLGIGRTFIVGSAASQEDSSDEPSETTDESSILPSPTSKRNE